MGRERGARDDLLSPLSHSPSTQVCASATKGHFYMQWDPALCPGKTPPRPSFRTATGAGYRGSACRRVGGSMTTAAPKRESTSSPRGVGVERDTRPKGLNFLWAILVVAVVAAMCAGVFVMARKAAAANKPPAGVQMGGVPAFGPGGGGGPPPPGSYVPGGAPPPGGAAPAPPAGVQYSYEPAAAGGAPPGAGVLLPGAADGGKPPGAGGYPKI